MPDSCSGTYPTFSNRSKVSFAKSASTNGAVEALAIGVQLPLLLIPGKNGPHLKDLFGQLEQKLFGRGDAAALIQELHIKFKYARLDLRIDLIKPV